MADSQPYSEEDIENLAKVAGSNVSPENRGAIAANLAGMRAAVLTEARTLPEDLGPILTMDPRWRAKR